jgi:hypothetical protein
MCHAYRAAEHSQTNSYRGRQGPITFVFAPHRHGAVSSSQAITTRFRRSSRLRDSGLRPHPRKSAATEGRDEHACGWRALFVRDPLLWQPRGTHRTRGRDERCTSARRAFAATTMRRSSPNAPHVRTQRKRRWRWPRRREELVVGLNCGPPTCSAGALSKGALPSRNTSYASLAGTSNAPNPGRSYRYRDCMDTGGTGASRSPTPKEITRCFFSSLRTLLRTPRVPPSGRKPSWSSAYRGPFFRITQIAGFGDHRGGSYESRGYYRKLNA